MVFSTLLNEGGPVMPLILLALLAGCTIAFERLLVWASWHLRDRPFAHVPDAETLETLLDSLPPPPGGTLYSSLLVDARALRDLPQGRREAALRALLLERVPRVETRIGTIGWLGTILPMLGLLGTVSGMIATFQDLATTTSRQVLSVGLSEALWTTEVGLIGALPLLAAHHLLSSLKTRWLNRLERSLALLFPGEPWSAGDPPSPSDSAGVSSPSRGLQGKQP